MILNSYPVGCALRLEVENWFGDRRYRTQQKNIAANAEDQEQSGCRERPKKRMRGLRDVAGRNRRSNGGELTAEV